MPDRPILVDTTRLLTRLGHSSPSGIDRVDHAYARTYLTGGADRRALAITPFGPRLMPARAAEELLRDTDRRWTGSSGDPAGDPAFLRVQAQLAGAAPPVPSGPRPSGARPRRIAPGRHLAALGRLAWPDAEREAPRGAVYLHSSHLRLDRPERFGWLSRRPDIRPVFFVHDLIPIEFPEYAVPGEAARHATRMRTIGRHAAAVLVNSADVGGRLTEFLRREGLAVPPIAVAPLAVEPDFIRAARSHVADRRYFVVCSTIEARKNHLLLLQIWRDLAARHGPDIPALLVVGRRGWESEAALDLLDRSPALRGHVFEVTGLSTPGLTGLLAGAQGLLMPSFAEGYGIPVVEALTVGTPAIVSDLPVFREIAGGRATFLHPLDGPGWTAAILRAARSPVTGGRGDYVPPTWDAHVRIVEDLLRSL